MFNRPLTIAASGLAVLALAGCGAGAPKADTGDKTSAGYPVTITSCGVSTTLTAKPEHAVTLNQGATQVVLALGAGDQLAGTAYLDDAIPAKWKAAYDAIPVLSKEYPSKEQFLAAKPDFAYASYASAFADKAVGTQSELTGEHIASYLSPFGCDDKSQRPQTTWQAVWDEVDSIGTAFGVEDRATALEKDQQATLDNLETQAAGKGLKVFWYDSSTKTPFVGAGHGGPQLIVDAVGATNIFAGLDGGWADGSWEKVVAADPDVIVLADASWDTAKSKIAYLEKDPVLSKLRAVKEHRFVTIPFSESTPSVLLVDGAASVSEQIAKLASKG